MRDGTLIDLSSSQLLRSTESERKQQQQVEMKQEIDNGQKLFEKFPKRVNESASQLYLGVFRQDDCDLHGIQQT